MEIPSGVTSIGDGDIFNVFGGSNCSNLQVIYYPSAVADTINSLNISTKAATTKDGYKLYNSTTKVEYSKNTDGTVSITSITLGTNQSSDGSYTLTIPSTICYNTVTSVTVTKDNASKVSLNDCLGNLETLIYTVDGTDYTYNVVDEHLEPADSKKEYPKLTDDKLCTLPIINSKKVTKDGITYTITGNTATVTSVNSETTTAEILTEIDGATVKSIDSGALDSVNTVYYPSALANDENLNGTTKVAYTVKDNSVTLITEEDITIPSTVCGISVTAITYGDVTYTINGNELEVTSVSTSATAVTIPDSIGGKKVTTVAEGAFTDCTITSLTTTCAIRNSLPTLSNININYTDEKYQYTQNSTNTIDYKCSICGNVARSVTITAPSDCYYTGKPISAIVEYSGTWSDAEKQEITITYKKKDNTSLDKTPTDAGVYIATMTASQSENSATASVEYTIKCKTISKDMYNIEGTKAEGNEWYTGNVVITAKEGYTLYEYEDSSSSKSVENITIGNDTNGTNVRFYVVGIDGYVYSAKSNTFEAESLNIKIDTQSPEISIKTDKNPTTGSKYDDYDDSVTFTITATDSGSDVDTITYTLDEEKTVKLVDDNTITVNTKGMHKLTVTATDKAGNKSENTVIDFTIWKTPEISIVTDDESPITYDGEKILVDNNFNITVDNIDANDEYEVIYSYAEVQDDEYVTNYETGLPTYVGSYIIKAVIAEDGTNYYRSASTTQNIIITQADGTTNPEYQDAQKSFDFNCKATIDEVKAELEKNNYTLTGSIETLNIGENTLDVTYVPTNTNYGNVNTTVTVNLAHVWSSTYTVDKSATCMSMGSKSKHCTLCNEKTNVSTILAKGHTYGEPTFTWDGTQCTATFTCQNNSNHIVVMSCEVSTEETAEQSIYTATVQLNGESYSVTNAVQKPAQTTVAKPSTTTKITTTTEATTTTEPEEVTTTAETEPIITKTETTPTEESTISETIVETTTTTEESPIEIEAITNENESETTTTTATTITENIEDSNVEIGDSSKDDFLLGDVSLNGEVDAFDLLLLKKCILGMTNLEKGSKAFKAGDINQDVQLKSDDLLIFKKFLLRMVSTLE